MNQPQEKLTYPKSLVLPSGEELTLVNSPELKRFFDACVSVSAEIEKNKLYKTLQAREKEIEVLKQSVETANKDSLTFLESFQKTNDMLEKAKGEIAQLTSENITFKNQFLAEGRTPTPNTSNLSREEIVNIVNEATQAAINSFAKQLPETLQKQIAPISEVIQGLKQKEVSDYREARIRELGDAIIPELVVGDTKEAIDASIEHSKGIRAKYAPVAPAAAPAQPAAPVQPAQPFVSTGNAEMDAKLQQAGNSPAPVVPNPTQGTVITPVLPSHSNPAMESMPNLKDMPLEEFEANRGSIAQKMKAYMDSLSQQSGF